MRIGVRHAFDLRPPLKRDMRCGAEIKIIGLRAGHLHPTQEDFRVTGLDGKAAGGMAPLRFLPFAPPDPSHDSSLLRVGHIFENSVVAAIDDVHTAFLIHRDAVREIDLSLRFPTRSE